MFSRRRRGKDESNEDQQDEEKSSDSQQQREEFANGDGDGGGDAGGDGGGDGDGDGDGGDDGGGDGGGGGPGGSEDSPKMLSEVHAMLTVLLRSFDVPLPTAVDATPKRIRIRRIKSKVMALVATPAARGIENVIKYIIREMPVIIQRILR